MGNCCGKTSREDQYDPSEQVVFSVIVPKDKQGHVIGRGGETINRIQSDTGTRIDVPSRNDPSTRVVIRGPRAGCQRAQARIIEVSGGHAGSDTTATTASSTATSTATSGSGYGTSSSAYSGTSTSTSGASSSTADTSSSSEEFRAQAAEHARLRDMYFQQSRAAYEAGDGAKAKELSNKGHEQTALLKKANKAAERATFAKNNAGRGDDEIDLHGLHVDEALEIVKERLHKRKKPLRVITGAGHHSDHGKAKIKPAVLSYFRKQGYKFDTENEGSFMVHPK